MFELIQKRSTKEFSDKRLTKRYEQIRKLLKEGQSCIINQISTNRAERKGSYDFFQNKRVEEKALKSKIYEQLANAEIQGEHLLVLQDTTEYNYFSTKDRIKDKSGLGDLSGQYGIGYFSHPSMVLKEQTGEIIGISDIQLWHRGENRANASSRKQRAFEDKESYKWYVGLSNSHKRLSEAAKITYVQDRDGDIYESILKVKSLENAELLVRNCRDRKIVQTEEGHTMLYEHLKNQSVQYNYQLEIQGDKRKNRTKRVAELEVRSARVQIICPANLKGIGPKELEVDVVWVREKASSVPIGEQAIDWKLVTTHEVHGDQVKIEQLIRWYVERWKIEEFFLSQKRVHTIWKMLNWKQAMVFEDLH